jgi:hypothetical protein
VTLDEEGGMYVRVRFFEHFDLEVVELSIRTSNPDLAKYESAAAFSKPHWQSLGYYPLNEDGLLRSGRISHTDFCELLKRAYEQRPKED